MGSHQCFPTLQEKAASKTNQSQRTRCCCFIMKEEKHDPVPFLGYSVPVVLPLVSGSLSEDLAVVHLKFTAAAACKWLAVTGDVVRGYCAK